MRDKSNGTVAGGNKPQFSLDQAFGESEFARNGKSVRFAPAKK